MTGPLPLDDVLRIVERRRRRRARVRTAAAPALSVAAVGVAGLVVVALQSGVAEDVLAPAAPPISAPPISVLPTDALPTGGPPTGDGPPSFDPAYLEPGFLPALADFLFGDSADDDGTDRRFSDAEELSRAWGLDLYPAAKAVVAKAALTGVSIDPADRSGDDVLVDAFAAAGFTDTDADELATAWRTDERTARVVGGLLVEAGYAEG